MHESGADVDWAAIKEVYEAGEVALSRICAEHGITLGRLKYRRRVEGWRVRPQVAQAGRPTRMRRPVQAAIILIAQLIEAQSERLLAVPEGETMPPAVPEAQLNEIANLAKVVEGLMREDNRRREIARHAAGRKTSRGTAAGGGQGKSSAGSAMDGGRSKEEELRAADVEWMRAELKRRVATLRRSAGLDGADRGAGG